MYRWLQRSLCIVSLVQGFVALANASTSTPNNCRVLLGSTAEIKQSILQQVQNFSDNLSPDNIKIIEAKSLITGVNIYAVEVSDIINTSEKKYFFFSNNGSSLESPDTRNIWKRFSSHLTSAATLNITPDLVRTEDGRYAVGRAGIELLTWPYSNVVGDGRSIPLELTAAQAPGISEKVRQKIYIDLLDLFSRGYISFESIIGVKIQKVRYSRNNREYLAVLVKRENETRAFPFIYTLSGSEKKGSLNFSLADAALYDGNTLFYKLEE